MLLNQFFLAKERLLRIMKSVFLKFQGQLWKGLS
jgi:hypothetical protein